MLVTVNELSQPSNIFEAEFQGLEAKMAQYQKQIELLEEEKKELAAKAAVGREALLKLEEALNVLGDNQTFRTAVASLVGIVPVEPDNSALSPPTRPPRPEESPRTESKNGATPTAGKPETGTVKEKTTPTNEPQEDGQPQAEGNSTISAGSGVGTELKPPPELPPEPEAGQPHRLQFAISKHNGSTTFLVVGKAGNKYECLNHQGQRLFFPEEALNLLTPTQTQIPADFVKFNQPLPDDLLSDAVWGRIKLLAAEDKEEFQAVKAQLKAHQDGLLGSLWKYWLTDEDRQKVEENAKKEPKKVTA